jgi:stage V sporulation protein D (sporulation-specific penicillin-binding protein)
MDMGLALGVSRFYRFLHLFGLLTPPPVDLPGATAGLFLPPQVVRPIDLATMAFGQTNEISALQLAEAVSAVANGGLLLRPHVLKEVLSPDGKVLRVVRPQVIRRVMPPWVAQEIVKGMAAVITPQGTGALAAVPGYVLAGKTGTAQLVRAGHVSTSQYMSSFIGFGPLPHPRVLILVQLDHPQGQYYGGQIAAPLFAQLMGETLRYLGIPPSQPTPQPGLTQVPQVVGLPYAQGVATLGAHHLTAFPEGSGPWIAAVVPDAGTWVVKGQAVLVVRSTTRPRPVFLAGNVPDLVGLPLRKAEMAAWDAGLRLAPQGSGVAVSQWPLPGTRLPPGSTVRARFVLPPLPRVRVRP